jgi:hypothetical protein
MKKMQPGRASASPEGQDVQEEQPPLGQEVNDPAS